MTVDINLSQNLSVRPDRNDDLRFGLQRTRKIARICGHILHNHRFTLSNRCFVDPFRDQDTNMLRGSAPKRFKNKNVLVLS